MSSIDPRKERAKAAAQPRAGSSLLSRFGTPPWLVMGWAASALVTASGLTACSGEEDDTVDPSPTASLTPEPGTPTPTEVPPSPTAVPPTPTQLPPTPTEAPPTPTQVPPTPTPEPTPGPGEVTGTSPTASEDVSAIAARIGAVLALGYNTTNADVVFTQLSGLDPKKLPENLVVVDTREAEDFGTGHIPGAINIPLLTLPTRLLDGTSGIPTDKEVVVASYWGNDGNMASLLINLWRIADPANAASYPKSTALFQGMTTWSFDRDLVPQDTRFEDAVGYATLTDGELETTLNDGVDQGAFPSYASFGTDDLTRKILLRAQDYFDRDSQFDLQIFPTTLAEELADGDSSDDPQIISVRSAADYKSGHIPGAINMPYKSVADLANYTKFVETSRPVVAYCYTGHTGALATMSLGLLGYNVRNILYGINGWNLTTQGSGQLKSFDVNKAWDFPLNTWDGGLDSVAEYNAPTTGCEGCHSSLTALWEDTILDPIEAGAAPPSTGEG